ncbi:MAG: NAD-dependent malic enzyme [Acidobacteria bacterium]|nr:NAD-dependent malic enzyme [Acidobacteriota bacterium]
MSSHGRIPDLDFVFEIRSLHQPGNLGKLLTAIGNEEGLIGDITTKFVGKTHSIREITISVFDEQHLARIQEAIEQQSGAEIIGIKDPIFEVHKGGKIHSGRKTNIRNLADLRYVYTPGVARVCRAIHEEPSRAWDYTGLSNSVGIFTNGTRVLGLGDIGVLASLPLMEGKAVIYDQFAGISATPVLVNTKDPKEFVDVVERVALSFGGIHLEDIRIPDCFYIEGELACRLRKPVMHNDQHGTATVVLAALLSVIRQLGVSDYRRLTVAQIGLGAAGFGTAKLLMEYGFQVIGVDINAQSRQWFTTCGGTTATLEDAMARANIVIAATGVPGLLTKEMIRSGQTILALSNPVPEIYPEEALEAGAAFACDGKMINNALVYPGLFKAALAMNAEQISSGMKIAAAEAIFALTDKEELVPSMFHPDLHRNITEAVKNSASSARF